MGSPVRLLDEPGLTAAERSLLEDMSRPMEYDIARGAVRFRTTLVALGALGVAATAAKSASASGVRAVLGKLSLKLAVWMAIPSVVAGTAVAVLVAGREVPVAPSPPRDERGAEPRERSEPAERRGSGREASRGGKAPVNQSEPAERRAAEEPASADAPLAAAEGVERTEPARALPRRRPLPEGHAVAAHEAAPLAPQRVELEETDESWPATAAAERTVPQPSTDTAAKGEASERETRRPAPEPARATPAPREESAERARAATSAAPPSDTVREMQGIVRARSLLQTDPAAALVALDAVRRAYPRGFFVEERRALTIFALRRAGNLSAAKAQAASFLKRYPDGPFTDKVRAVAAP